MTEPTSPVAGTASPAAGTTPSPDDGVPLTPPEGYDLVLRVAPMPADVNGNGDIFGGWVMAQVDIAGGIAAARRARGRVVTVAVNAFQFKQPVSVGDVVSFYARIVATGRTSITVHVEVISVRDPENLKTVKVTEATLTYVAIERSGVKREVPPLPSPSPSPLA